MTCVCAHEHTHDPPPPKKKMTPFLRAHPEEAKKPFGVSASRVDHTRPRPRPDLDQRPEKRRIPPSRPVPPRIASHQTPSTGDVDPHVAASAAVPLSGSK